MWHTFGSELPSNAIARLRNLLPPRQGGLCSIPDFRSTQSRRFGVSPIALSSKERLASSFSLLETFCRRGRQLRTAPLRKWRGLSSKFDLIDARSCRFEGLLVWLQRSERILPRGQLAGFRQRRSSQPRTISRKKFRRLLRGLNLIGAQGNRCSRLSAVSVERSLLSDLKRGLCGFRLCDT